MAAAYDGAVPSRQPETLYFLKFVVARGAMITPAQIRAARALLRWTQAMLAHRSGVSTVTLNMIENETVNPREATLAGIQASLEAGGVQFLTRDGAGIGVQFAPSPVQRRPRHSSANSDNSTALRSDTARNTIPPRLHPTTV